MAKASDNPYPSILIEEGTEPTAPAAGHQRLYIDSTSHHLSRTDSSGTEVDIEATAGGLTIEDADASPQISASTLVFENGTLVDEGAGVASYTAPTGGGLTQAYVGYNTVGGTWETMTNRRHYMKKITLANDCLLTSIDTYLQGTGGNADSFGVAVASDNAGDPDLIIGFAALEPEGWFPTTVTPRWVTRPVGQWLTAGDYWLVVFVYSETSLGLQIAKDGSGSDRFGTAGGDQLRDPQNLTVTTSTDTYSIRANTIR